MNKEDLKNIVQHSVKEVWYNRRSFNPVEEQTELLTNLLWDYLNDKNHKCNCNVATLPIVEAIINFCPRCGGKRNE